MTADNDKFKELVRIGDPIEADLLAAFLEDGEITFKLIKTAQTMASLMPATQTPIVFQVLEDDLPRAQELLEEYREQQRASMPPDANGNNDSED